MPFCGRASAWSKAAFLLLIPAMGLYCAGLGTPFWMKSSTINNSVNISIGLWKMVNCSGSLTTPCVGTSIPGSYSTAMFHVTQAVECAVIIPMALAFVLSLFYVTSPAARTQKVAAWIMLFSFISVGLFIVGAVVWTLNLPSNHYVYWSFGLTLFAASLLVLVAVLMIQDIRMFDYEGIRLRKEAKREKRAARRNQRKKQQY
ncbi:uncharacterized protein LOC132743098 [Ruditapes philippinarum]|uniref:uncharacterized protein LOC132743098 n=1 Tax=Ruditapes philippinarum TaxID=129788 RepID=UPI00295BD1D3|nr:uncharacterized protein LOC132743098 [Ruditapes philippinarum]